MQGKSKRFITKSSVGLSLDLPIQVRITVESKTDGIRMVEVS